MLFEQSFECPSCGGQIPRKTPASKSLVCPYCGQTSHIHADTLEAAGNKHLLIDYGSSLSIGQTFKLGEAEGLILGRLRLDYEDGFWDEWYAQMLHDGSEAWIQEDDGSFVLFYREKDLPHAPRLEEIAVGQVVDLGELWEPFFVTAKSKAKVNGGEGELPFRIVPGEPADFVDGIWDGRPISIELLPGEKVLFVGRPFSLDELQLT